MIRIISIEGLTTATMTAAEAACEQQKVRSVKDTLQLAEAKKIVYMRGFEDGVMLVSCGEYSGLRVSS